VEGAQPDRAAPRRVDVFPESAIEEGELIASSPPSVLLPEILKIKAQRRPAGQGCESRYVSRSDFLTIGELADRTASTFAPSSSGRKGLIALTAHRRRVPPLQAW